MLFSCVLPKKFHEGQTSNGGRKTDVFHHFLLSDMIYIIYSSINIYLGISKCQKIYVWCMWQHKWIKCTQEKSDCPKFFSNFINIHEHEDWRVCFTKFLTTLFLCLWCKKSWEQNIREHITGKCYLIYFGTLWPLTRDEINRVL